MIVEYSVLVKRNNNSQITGYYYPDFDFEHKYTESESINLDQDINIVLTNYIREMSKSESIPFPKELSYYKKIVPSNMLDQWGLCQINPFFMNRTEKCLPLFGVISSIIGAITMAIINFYTIEDSISSEAGIVIGSIGSVLSAAVEIIIYIFSNANEISKIIGRKIDDTILRKKRNLIAHQNGQTNYSGIKLALRILLTIVPIATTTYSSYSHYIQVSSIIADGNNSDDISTENMSTENMSTEIFMYTAVIMIFFSSYSKLIFQLSFMLSFYGKLAACPCAKTERHHAFKFLRQHNSNTSSQDKDILLTSDGQSQIEMSGTELVVAASPGESKVMM